MTDYDLIQQFIESLTEHGCEPANKNDIIADDKWHRYTVAGDKTPNARYQLRIEGEFGVGRFIYFKDSEAHSWHSKTNRKWSPEEKKAYIAKIALDKKQRKIEQKAEYAETAKDVTAVWRNAKEAKHPYLNKKKISGVGSRVGSYTDNDGKMRDNVLFIPIYKGNALSSLQRIFSNNFKAFWEGGDINGGYTVLATPADPKDNIIICEGWATGKSIREAMPDCPVFVAFNAGNLAAVAQFVRGKYKDARIVIAADNDQWTFKVKSHIPGIVPREVPGDDERWTQWRSEGRLTNVGIDKARQAAVKSGAHVIYPNIAGNDAGKNTDFNDLEHTAGLDAVRERIQVAAPASQQPESVATDNDDYPHQGSGTPLTEEEALAMFSQIPTYNDEGIYRFSELYAENDTQNEVSLCEEGDAEEPEKEEFVAVNMGCLPPKDSNWQGLLFYKDDGAPKPNSLDNTRIFIEHDPDYRGMIVFDSFSQEKIIAFKPPWERVKRFEPRTMKDEDVTWLAMHLEKKGIMPGLNNLRKVLDSCTMANCKNPAQEYFRTLKWDGVQRLDTWLRNYCGCKKDDPEYLAAVGRKWLTAAVSRVMNPGCKFESMLIFEGAQGLGKSMMLRELATIYGRAYFEDTIKAKDLPNPATIPKLQGVLIVELAEMSGFKKMGADEAKQVISTQYDRIVKKYQNEPTIMPRQFVLAGTINPKDGYLDDSTGNRRYWPVACTKMDYEGIKADREQLWAEAYMLYKAGEKIWLEGDLLEKAKAEQFKRQNIHPWQFDIDKITDCKNYITPDQIWNALQITDRTRRTKQAQDDIVSIMTGIGFEYKRTISPDGKRETAYVRNSDQIDFIEEYQTAKSSVDYGSEPPW